MARSRFPHCSSCCEILTRGCAARRRTRSRRSRCAREATPCRAAAPGVGDAALTALESESDARARALLAAALGALRHEPSIPRLVTLLADDDWLVRREAASSLGVLRAAVAELPLQRALVKESDAHSAEAMRAALAAITGKTLFALSPSAALEHLKLK